ncbi:MAG: MFS transporter [Rhodococcus sp. (in: high G+C Gram-positive bacteria)]|nr:MAG: MFS transporter [Rhodococcus sp. (in: high G+C Gram-positive bacteria)]
MTEIDKSVATEDRPTVERKRSESLGQPKGLWNLAFTELWERFSFYGLQGVLSFYLLYSLSDGGLELAPATAVSIVGAYGGSVYLSQILGAWIADRLIAPRRMVLYGAVIITAGHLALAVLDGLGGLAVGLALIVLGTGALKTNITSIVGMLYANNRAARDAGFSYFYMAINTGSAVGPLLTGFTQSRWGFHAAFGLAAIGMVGALIQYSWKMRDLPAEAGVVKNPIARTRLPYAFAAVAAVTAFVVALWQLGLVDNTNLSQFVGVVILVAAIIYFTVILRSRNVTPAEKRRMRGFIPLWIASLLYFGFLFQKFTTISVFIKDRVDLDVGGWQVPAPWLTTISPVSAVLLTPLVAMLWTKLGTRQPTTSAKFAIGLTMVGCAYLLLLLSQFFPDKTVPPLLVLVSMAIAGSSEIFVGPVGLALATRIAPDRFKAQSVALLFLTLAGGSTLSGLLGGLFTKISPGTFFLLVGSGAVLLGAVLLAVSRNIEALTDSR